MSEVLDIPVSDIHVGDRLSMPTDKDVEDVAGSMALEGLLQPIGVNRIRKKFHLVSMSAVSWTEPNGTTWTPVGIWAKSEDVDGPDGMVLVEKNRAYDAMLRVASDLLRPILESGMVVVDPMCRRGAIPIAAWSLGAHAIGLESDEGDAAYAQRNVDNHSGT